MSVTPILSWREASFVAAYADRADPRFSSRSPIERAIVAFILPNLLPAERTFVQANQFTVSFHEYDWRLNDLTGGAPQVTVAVRQARSPTAKRQHPELTIVLTNCRTRRPH